ncbi:MAG: cytochrome O ubiquinol oxidase [Nocardioides sp.]|nr:cytochrome O ubiquinol oxidase [Nocardioides sp.]
MAIGIDFLDPEWLLAQFGSLFFWVCLGIVFVECGLFFPFLPGDSLLFAIGIFIATGQLDIFPGPKPVELLIAIGILTAAAWAGNINGYEIGRRIGPPLRRHDGRVIKKKHLDKTEEFFHKHGKKALVIGRFLAFVRTYVTVVAGVTQMERRVFYVWSLIGGVAWVVSITLIGYTLGDAIPWLQHNIDYAILAILAFTAVPIAFEWWHNRRKARREAATSAGASSDAPVESPSTDAAGV